jgi:hypothetical protein
MKELSQIEKEKILSRIFWDYQHDWHELNEMLNGKPEDAKDIRRINLYRNPTNLMNSTNSTNQRYLGTYPRFLKLLY